MPSTSHLANFQSNCEINYGFGYSWAEENDSEVDENKCSISIFRRLSLQWRSCWAFCSENFVWDGDRIEKEQNYYQQESSGRNFELSSITKGQLKY